MEGAYCFLDTSTSKCFSSVGLLKIKKLYSDCSNCTHRRTGGENIRGAEYIDIHS
jgi:hypothetical protein